MAAEARSLREEIDLLKQAASDERRRLCGQIDNLQSNLAQTIREANEGEAALGYAKSMLDDESLNRVLGFEEGFREGALCD